MKLKHRITLMAAGALAACASQAQSANPGAAASNASQNTAPVSMPVFEVNTEKDEGYLSTHVIAGSRTLELLRDTPNSISILNRELMEDLNVTTINELSEYAVTGQIGDNTEGTAPLYVFRGIVANVRLRNGVKWLTPLDAYSIERVEVLRGPNAFLYGEGTAGGAMNQLTKQGQFRDFQRLNLLFGSYGLHRAELDINRQLNQTLALRFNAAYQDQDGFVNHTKRKFTGASLAGTYRPFRNTSITFNYERTATRATQADHVLFDAFSTTERTGSTPAYTRTTGGRTFIAALGESYHMWAAPAQRRSSGTNTAVLDTRLLPRDTNFWGPNAHHDSDTDAVNIQVAQKFGQALNVQASYSRQDILRDTRTNRGSSANGIYLDRNPLLPGGAPNPYYNEYYTEYNVTRLEHVERVHDLRLTAVYDLELSFMKQRIMLTGNLQDDDPNQKFYRTSEFVDPASSLFNGSLTDEQSLAAYRANVSTMENNRLYRRFYLRDGDGAHLTNNELLPGTTAMLHDSPSHGVNGRLSGRLFETPSFGFGFSGSYWGDRVKTLVGWRRDGFVQRTLSRALYDYATDTEYTVPETQVNPVHIYKNSINYGGVFHVSKLVSVYANYAESVGLSAGFGGEQLIPGTVRGVAGGDGYEFGLRWSLLDGRIESNWTYFITNVLNQGASPGIPNAVRNELSEIFTDINPSGGDRQTSRSTGIELETIANVTKNWRLIWNLSTSELELSNRYPALRHFQERAHQQNTPTPETDAFFETVPPGVPLPGFTKLTSNLVTNYRFNEGPLKGFSVGGGFNYRDQTYRGNFDFDRDGVAEKVYSPAYFLGNVMLGYRTRLLNRPVNLSLNVNNLFDKDYFKSRSIRSGAWGEPRSFRFAIRTEL